MKVVAWTAAGWIGAGRRLHREPQELESIERAIRSALDLGVEHAMICADPDLIEQMRDAARGGNRGGAGIPHRVVLGLAIVEGIPAVRQEDGEDTDASVCPVSPTEPPQPEDRSS